MKTCNRTQQRIGHIGRSPRSPRLWADDGTRTCWTWLSYSRRSDIRGYKVLLNHQLTPFLMAKHLRLFRFHEGSSFPAAHWRWSSTVRAAGHGGRGGRQDRGAVHAGVAGRRDPNTPASLPPRPATHDHAAEGGVLHRKLRKSSTCLTRASSLRAGGFSRTLEMATS
jgi:hypothetical protein